VTRRKTRTFVDSNVLILAARGTEQLSEKATSELDDPNRNYVTSDFVRLETLPKAAYHQQHPEVEFYEAFFSSARRLVKSTPSLIAEAEHEAIRYGLSAVDALHIAAAKRAKCHEFITAEKPTKPLFRVAGLMVRSIRSDEES
jgi:predicted nucleic acid-binding protein